MWKNVTYNPDYLDDMIEMTIENYGPEETIANKEFIQHEYFENPVGDALIELAYDDENRTLAGQYLVSPRLIYSRGKTIRAILSLNTLTREAYRGQKIFTGLAEITYQRAEREGFQFVYGAPNPNSHPGFLSKLSFVDLGDMPLYIRPLNTSQILQEKTGKKWLAAMASPGNVIFHSKRVFDNHIVRINKKNVGMINDFWDMVKDKYPVIGVRDSKYFVYRYLNVPVRKYYPYFYVVDGKVVAYAVGRVREVAKMNCGMIADLLCLDGYEKEAVALVKYLVHRMEKAGAGLSGCIMQEKAAEVKVLKRAGFFRCPQKILPQPTPIIYRKLNENYNDILVRKWNNWFFTTGDYDVV